MEIKDFFDKAFSDIRNDHHLPDNNAICKDILERAKNMKKDDNVRQMKFTEIPVTYTEPKKSTKILHAVAGVAGAAAVLAGAVFGLNWLNEHGGLKEGGIDTDTGAGYHDTLGSEYPEYTMTPEIIPEDIEFHFNGLTVKPMEYVYDGLTLQMTYKMTYPDAVSENFENDIALRIFDSNAVQSAEKLSVISKDRNTATLVWSQTGVEVKQSREVRFMPTREELIPTDEAAQEALGSCAVTVDFPDDSPIYTLEPKMLTYIFDEDEIHRIKKVNICKFTAEIVVDAPEPVPDNYIKDIKIVMKDGTELHPTDDRKILDAYSMNEKNEHYYLYSLPGIAPDTVDKVYINNIEITDKAAQDSESKDILQSVGDVLEFDGLTATIEKVDFDGTFLRVYYTPSGYKGENKEGSRRFQSAMMTLGTPETEAYDPRRVCSYVGAYDEESGLNCTAMFVDLDEGDTLDINFRYSEETGHYTLTGIGKSENTCVYDINNNGLRWIRLSPSGVVIASSEKYYTHDPQCSFSVIFKDGSSRRLYDDSIMYGGAANECSGGPIEEHFGLESGDIVTTFLSIDPDPIDVDNVAAVILNGEEIRFEEDTAIAALEYDDGSTVTINSYSYDGINLDLEYSVYVPEGSAPDYDPLSLKSPICRTKKDESIMPKNRSGEIPTYRCTLKTEEYNESVDLYFLPAYSSEEEYEKVIAEQDRYKFTAAVNSENVELPEELGYTPPDYYEGLEALDILKQYAGSNWCYPLENTDIDLLNYRTGDKWRSDESTGFRFNIAADEGAAVLAVTGGTVIEAKTEYRAGYGEGIYIIIQSEDDRKWRYSHCSELYAKVGDTVKAGDKIAAVGATGWCTGSCLAISFPDSDVIDPKQTAE